jgi:hypothetical protein
VWAGVFLLIDSVSISVHEEVQFVKSAGLEFDVFLLSP